MKPHCGTCTCWDNDDALSIDNLETAGVLSERTASCLRRKGVAHLDELDGWTEEDFLNITNFGQKSLEEVAEVLDTAGWLTNRSWSKPPWVRS